MTITSINTGLAIGGTESSAVGPVKTTLGANTAAVALNLQYTNGASVGDYMEAPRVFYAVSPFSVTAAQAVTQMLPVAESFDIVPARLPRGVTTQRSDLIVNTGGFLYTWFETPKMPDAATVTLNAAEID